MIVTTHWIDKEGNAIINHEVYHEVEKDSFRIRTEISKDDGATWEEGRYSLIATRQ